MTPLTTLYLKIGSLLAIAGTGYAVQEYYGTDGVGTEVIATANEVAATQSFSNIADAAYYGSLLGADWESALREETELARHNEAVSINGTRLFWRIGDVCYTTDLPTPDSKVEVRSC